MHDSNACKENKLQEDINNQLLWLPKFKSNPKEKQPSFQTN